MIKLKPHKNIEEASFETASHSGGFTLMELTVVVILFSVVALFGIPNYMKTIRRGAERNAIIQLNGIYAANEVYKARHGTYLVGTGLGWSDLNANLRIVLYTNDLTYSYTSANGGMTYTVTASWTGSPGFSLGITNVRPSATNPCCSSGADCPSRASC